MHQVTDNTIIVFSESNDDREFISGTLFQIFGSALNILPLESATLSTVPIGHAPKVVVVTESTRDIADSYFPESKIIYASRTITGQGLEEVIMLPVNTSVLVATHPMDVALETVQQLHSFGIHHLNLVPYWPGSNIDFSLYDTVLYAGISSYCPPNMAKYIDIGNRNLAFSVIMEITQAYGLTGKHINNVHENDIKLAISNYYKMDALLQEMENLKEIFEYICSVSSNVLIMIDGSDRISLINSVAENYLKLKDKDIAARDYREVFQTFPELLDAISLDKNIHDHLIRLYSKPALLSIYKISIGSSIHTLLDIAPADMLRRSEIKIRRKLSEHGFKAKYTFEDIKGNSPAIKKTIALAEQFAHSDANILISGQSGTGKELFAQAIHNNSIRAEHPFVAINFAALPESIAESELFGYEEGSFTGALKGGKIGLFERGHRGTIFLDEIGDASLTMQVKLLRVFEEREIMRVGSSQVIPINIRIICATNKDLLKMVENGEFREDLYYRIRVLPLNIPPLKERRSDIPLIINSLYEEFHIHNKLPDELLNRFIEYDWPGNIRELKSMIQYLFVLGDLTKDNFVDIPYLPKKKKNEILPPKHSDTVQSESTTEAAKQENFEISLSPDLVMILKEIQRLTDQNIPAGRYSLSKTERLLNANLTETKIKTRLRRLSEQGFIYTGKTRQGVRLTPKGLAVLLSDSTLP